MTEEPSDEWVEWTGGECPVDRECYVEVKFRDSEWDGVPNEGPAESFAWNWSAAIPGSWGGEIIAYRITE